jgi:hypothetical protein
VRVHLDGEQDDLRGDVGVADADVGVADDDVADLGRAQLPVPFDRVDQLLGDRRLLDPASEVEGVGPLCGPGVADFLAAAPFLEPRRLTGRVGVAA